MNRDETKAHLGVGWAFPIRARDGRLAFAQYEDLVEQAVKLILLTEPSERERLPEFGAGLRRFVFEPNNAATHRELERRITRALTEWEPRIKVESVSVGASEEEPSTALIDVDYVVRATNTAHNLVFPFFINEGGG